MGVIIGCWDSDVLFVLGKYLEVFSPKPVFPKKNIPISYLGDSCLALGAAKVLVGWVLLRKEAHFTPSHLLSALYFPEPSALPGVPKSGAYLV